MMASGGTVMRLKGFVVAAAMLMMTVGAAPARATTIPFFVDFTPGVSIEYASLLFSGELHAGDGFTLYDIYGFGGVDLLGLPPQWSASATLTGSPFGAPPLSTADDPGLANVSFTYLGPTIPFDPFNPVPTAFTSFLIFTTASFLAFDDWVSADHFPNGGGPAFPISGQTLVPSDTAATVPDGGSTAALLGSALLGFGLLRRRFGLR